MSVIQETKYKDIPSMTGPKVHRYLREIGKQWTGQGVVLEAGSWLGATAVPLLEGLIQASPRYNKYFYAAEKWEAYPDQVRKAAEQGFEIKDKQDLRPIFLKNTKKIYPNIVAMKGLLPKVLEGFPNHPIEICLFDAPKKDPIFIESIRALYKYFIPGVTILGLLDYNFYRSKEGTTREANLAPVRFIERNQECFTKLWEDGSPAFFRYEKELIDI